MTRWTPYFLTTAFLLLGQLSSGQPADTLNLYDNISTTRYLISVSDYKSALKDTLGAKANLYMHFIDSISLSSKDSILYLEKGYCTSLNFYEREDYTKLDNALISAFLKKKARIVKNDKSYNVNNTKITKRKTRICNKPLGAVTGTNWVIKDADNNTTITELNRSTTKNAYRLINCF